MRSEKGEIVFIIIGCLFDLYFDAFSAECMYKKILFNEIVIAFTKRIIKLVEN